MVQAPMAPAGLCEMLAVLEARGLDGLVVKVELRGCASVVGIVPRGHNQCGIMGQHRETKHQVSRRYPRVALAKGMLVAWQCSDGKGVSRVATLGLGGLFISAPDPPPVGSLMKLLFDAPDGEVRARAVVKNVEPGHGMAVAFVDMGYADRARLNQLLKKLLR